jgi:hypothetical protein
LNLEPKDLAMPILSNLSRLKEKILISILCIIGISSVAYGMLKKNNPVFIIGIIFVIAGYLLIRRKLKESIQKQRQ